MLSIRLSPLSRSRSCWVASIRPSRLRPSRPRQALVFPWSAGMQGALPARAEACSRTCRPIHLLSRSSRRRMRWRTRTARRGSRSSPMASMRLPSKRPRPWRPMSRPAPDARCCRTKTRRSPRQTRACQGSSRICFRRMATSSPISSRSTVTTSVGPSRLCGRRARTPRELRNLSRPVMEIPRNSSASDRSTTKRQRSLSLSSCRAGRSSTR